MLFSENFIRVSNLWEPEYPSRNEDKLRAGRPRNRGSIRDEGKHLSVLETILGRLCG
jgi:hypothetical protein